MNYKYKKLLLASMFLVLGAILPFLTLQIKEIGDSLLPMHLPIILCGLICGAKYGCITGFVLPFFRAVAFGMPPIFPNALWMALELATYGLVIGFLYPKKQHSLKWLYVSLITTMLSGRIIWGISKAILLGLKGSTFTFAAFWIGGFVDSFLGIVLQLILIPNLMFLYNKYYKKE